MGLGMGESMNDIPTNVVINNVLYNKLTRQKAGKILNCQHCAGGDSESLCRQLPDCFVDGETWDSVWVKAED